jgi:hypothetical protein
LLGITVSNISDKSTFVHLKLLNFADIRILSGMTDVDKNANSCPCPNEGEALGACECEGFGDLLKFTIPGYIAALVAGFFFDFYGFQKSGWGQVVVRTLAGEGESILEGFYSLRQRLRQRAGSLAEAYGWGKLFGMTAPWIIDGFSRLAGIDMFGAESFYVPYFYALSDQIGANISGALFLRRQQGSWPVALRIYVKNPVMITSLMVILLVPVGLLMVRVAGFSPTTQKYTALETIAANLCWLPVMVGWLTERLKK